MKLAVTGKGGVGKTTLSALLAQAYADMGRQVLAVDADPSPCLAGALGFPDEQRKQLKPISEMDDLIYERTGARPGTTGGFTTTHAMISLNGSALHRNVRFEMGAVDIGGSDVLPRERHVENAFTHLPGEVLILDMYAGVEHLAPRWISSMP
jgi:CO dehydrogenase maturation factor